ncbi:MULTISPECIES: NADPH-dependent FMN reductase [Pseudoalteromonas]|uniref:NADPH-dependent FMN reductase n=1 Tax=Pseudoalteromonas amylolytica TaxID=1859457 RepID=A0A1S1MXC5_9GAMM|nr:MULTISPECIES: NAD(P)H-dependent oxidoreductase [Pseudoalteromonas]OHU88119.1 NADPH-dependent FMN reductase [Pseudoalteromonas sp. JW3]OHU91559.1 NADPH-dependent FMN reductase [Pseudoalteromonas amylolytica]
MKVLAFAASSSRQSINKQLATYAASLVEGAQVEVLDLNDFEMPIYSSDRENEQGIPAQAQTFYKKIAEADAIIVSFAEHNGSYTAAYKNLFDWTSRISQKVYQDTPMVLLATSPGPGGAKSVLGSATGSAPFFAMDVKASMSVPSFYDVFDSEKGELTDETLKQQLKESVFSLQP